MASAIRKDHAVPALILLSSVVVLLSWPVRVQIDR